MNAPEPVLSMMNADGSRRWIRPRPSSGKYFRRRRITAYSLMLVFLLLPYIQVGGKPLILLDLPRREFTLFGSTFLPTETLLVMLLMLSIAIAVFLLTALFGRVWCGWACPQTVYMEFLFRPIERWLEGGYSGSLVLDRTPGLKRIRFVKHAIYALLAVVLAHTFLAYFVGVKELAAWMHRSPVEHPTSFFVMLATTALIFFDFSYFREQTCLVACPYGRLQSVLLDRQSTIVSYDKSRGEPRMRHARTRPAGAGDCIDCRLCVITCPTGIDIRNGLQMECIHCTQCADACDSVMKKIGKPPGLIRYTSRDAVEGRATRVLRPRVVLYPAVLAITLGLFVWALASRTDAELTVLRAPGAPFVPEPDGSVINQIMVKVRNHGSAAREYHIELDGAPGARLIAPVNPMPVAAGEVRTAQVFVVLPRRGIPEGELPISFRVSDGHRFNATAAYRLVGPEHEEHDDHPESHGRPGREEH